MTKFTVALADHTVGTLYAEAIEVGQVVTVRLQDENGIAIEVTGEIAEVLE